MLSLSRKNGQSIMIGENIKITLLKEKSGRTKIGIEAPQEVKILRDEIYRQNQEEVNGNK